MKNKPVLTAILITMGILGGLTACKDDAQVASHNLSKAADNFEVQRRIVFVNAFTDEYLFEVVGRCSVNRDRGQLVATCKHGPKDFRKHFLGVSDNAPYVVEQLKAVDVSVYHTRITFKPQQIIPDIDFRGDTKELVTPRDTSN